MNKIYSYIAGTGAYTPEKVLNNHDLEKLVDTSDEWITTRTGIKERRIAPSDTATSDLATVASRIAIEDSGLKPEQIDMIICATITPDMPFPSTACIIQRKLGIENAAAFDISAACSGFIYGLFLADLFIRSGDYHNVLVIGAESLSKIVDWEDRSTCVLFGDGAGAVIVRQSVDERCIKSCHIFSDGRYSDFLQVIGGGSLFPCSHETVDNRMHFIKMKGNETFKLAVKSMVNASEKALSHNGISVDDVDMLICHQANTRIIQAAAQRLGIPDDKVFNNLDRFGNTSAASIPIALWDAVRQEKLTRGKNLLLTAFGGGLTWGSALIKW